MLIAHNEGRDFSKTQDLKEGSDMLFMIFGSVLSMLFWLIVPLLLLLVPLAFRLMTRRGNRQNDINTQSQYRQGEFIDSEFVDDGSEPEDQDSQK